MMAGENGSYRKLKIAEQYSSQFSLYFRDTWKLQRIRKTYKTFPDPPYV